MRADAFLDDSPAKESAPATQSAESFLDAESFLGDGPSPEPKNEQPGMLSNSLRNAGERGMDLFGNAIQFAGRLIESGEEKITDSLGGFNPGLILGGSEKLRESGREPDLELGGYGVDFTTRLKPEETNMGLQGVGQAVEDVTMGFQPKFTIDNALDNPSVESIIGAAAENGPAALADMAALIISAPAYLMARTQEIAEERVRNNFGNIKKASPELQRALVKNFQNGDPIPEALQAEAEKIALPGWDDYKIAGPTATASVLVDRFALSRLLPGGRPLTSWRKLPAAVGAAIVSEGSTEALQEGGIEYAGEVLGTETEWEGGKAVRRALGGIIVGGPTGGAVRAGTGAYQLARKRVGPEGSDDSEVDQPEDDASQDESQDWTDTVLAEDFLDAEDSAPEPGPSPGPGEAATGSQYGRPDWATDQTDVFRDGVTPTATVGGNPFDVLDQSPPAAPEAARAEPTQEYNKQKVDNDLNREHTRAREKRQADYDDGATFQLEPAGPEEILVQKAQVSMVVDAEMGRELLDEAVNLGRMDVAEFSVRRAEGNASAMSVTPGVPESSPKYQAIKRDLEARKEKQLDGARKLRSDLEAEKKRGTEVGRGQSGAKPQAGAPLTESGTGVFRVPVDQINVDPEQYQFRSNMNEKGVDKRLDGVEKWDDGRANNILLHRKKDGSLFVADGHHRLDLAKRLGQTELNARIVSEVDGFDVQKARLEGATNNISDGKAVPVDVAKVFRDSGVAAKDVRRVFNLPNSQVVIDGEALSKLSDNVFGMVASGQMSEKDGAAVGAAFTEQSQQEAAASAFQKIEPQTDYQRQLLINEIRAADFAQSQGDQGGLFGEDTQEISLMQDRLKVLDSLRQQLNADKRLFKSLNDNADRATGAGNTIATEANATITESSARSLDLIARVTTTPALNDMVNRAARRVFDGEARATVAKELKQELSSYETGRNAESSRRPNPAPSRTANAGARPEPGAGESVPRQNAAGTGQDGQSEGATAEVAADPDFDLAAQTETDLAEQAAAKAESDKAEAQAKRDADQKEKAAADRAFVKGQSEAAADTFELGGNAMDNLTGQGGTFDEPATPEPAAAPKASD